MDLRYQECSNSLRHYSTQIFKIRTTALVHGLVILILAGKLYIDQVFALLLYATIAYGILSNFVLLFLHIINYNHFEKLLGTIREIEKDVFAQELSENKRLPWTWYSDIRGNELWLRLVHYSTFILIFLAYIVLILLVGFHRFLY